MGECVRPCAPALLPYVVLRQEGAALVNTSVWCERVVEGNGLRSSKDFSAEIVGGIRLPAAQKIIAGYLVWRSFLACADCAHAHLFALFVEQIRERFFVLRPGFGLFLWRGQGTRGRRRPNAFAGVGLDDLGGGEGLLCLGHGRGAP